ncbi:hypothetical protein ACL02U_09705 [Streptomyces sp. MS06]|uniref:hypothetical protein n=1 Tax=Streptomyces sp. MS06 TaxID=3385974 RepID=UPI0039A228D3
MIYPLALATILALSTGWCWGHATARTRHIPTHQEQHMSDRLTVDTITSDQLDALIAERDDAREQLHLVSGMRQRNLDAAAVAIQRAEQAEAERDGAYRERAQLIAWLAALHPDHAVLAPALDIDDEDGWHLLFLTVAGRQLSWHIAPRDVELFQHVQRVDPADPRAQWDGHTTAEKYQRIAALSRR